MHAMNETLGSILKRYREEEHISLDQVERDLKISMRNLRALENGDFAKLPEDLYTRNFIRSYARYLNLDTQKLVDIYDAERAAAAPKKDHGAPHPTTPTIIITPRTIKLGVGILVAAAVCIYLAYQIIHIFRPPTLTVTEPEQNLRTSASFITVAGSTEKEARVFINQKEIFPDPSGAFRTSLDLQNGLNVITVSAAKKHSKETVVYREILVTE